MKNKIVIAIVILIFVFVFFINKDTNNTDSQNLAVNIDSRNGTYVIDGRSITLKNGYSEESVDHSLAKIITRYFGNEIVGDFNKDGLGDTGFLITTDNGGSGLFYYFVVNLGVPGGFKSTNTVFIGDRVAPQSTNLSIKDNTHIVLNYADRMPGDPMTEYPRVGKSIILGIVNGQLGQVIEDFEGEVDVNRMNLTMTKWGWLETKYTDGTVLAPKRNNEFYINFNNNGKVEIETDCNNGFAVYESDNSKKTLILGPIGSTLMFCVDSQETEFINDLQNVEKYEFTNRGNLVLVLKNGAGSIILK